MALVAMHQLDPNWKDMISDSEDEEIVGTSNLTQPEKHLTNRFVDALVDAARLYSEESERSSIVEPRFRPSDGVVGEIEEVKSEIFSDSEEEDDQPAKFTALNWSDAMGIFYKPVGDWAALASQPIEDSRVIKTLHAGAMCEAFIKQGRIAGREITYISKTWILDQRWEGFFSEMAFYSHPDYLQPLQGAVVPTIIGVYLIDRRISVAMELPHSSFWVEATEDMSVVLKRKCISALDRIHERGVLHGDVELRHMLVNAEGDVTIIDFQMSQALRPIKEVGLEACTLADIRVEKRKVLFKLNYGDAQEYEHAKRRRVNSLASRNERRRERRLHSSEPVSDDEDEDPDDVLNPIVPPGTWLDEWLTPGLDFESTCFVVPGQDGDTVRTSLKAFADHDSDTRKREAEIKVSPKSNDPSPSVSATSLSCVASNSPQKRKRGESDSADEGDEPSSKKPALPPSSDFETIPVDIPSDFCNPPALDFKSLIGMDIEEIIVHPNERDRLHIPFEGWDGKGGGVMPNELVDDGVGKYLGDRRRRWIMDANAARCRRLGLPHPSNNPSPRPSPSKGPRSGKKKHLRKKPLVAMGSIKRDLEDKFDPLQAAMEMDWKKMKYLNRRGKGDFVKDGGAEDSDDDHPELPSGPRIMKWSDLKSEWKGKGTYNSTGDILKQRAFVGGSSPGKACRSGRMRGALRRPYTLEERLRQKAYESTTLALRPREDGEDEDASISPKLFSIRRDLKRAKRPPALNTSTGVVSASTCTSSATVSASLTTRPTSSTPTTLDGTTFIPHQRAHVSGDHFVTESTLRRLPTRSPPKSQDDGPHASAPARLPVAGGSTPSAPFETNSGNISGVRNHTTRSNAPPALHGSIARVPRRRLSLQGRRGSLVTGASSSPTARPPLRPRSNSSPPNVLISSATHRYINVGVHSAPASPTVASSSEAKAKAVDPTLSVDFRRSLVSPLRGAHLMDTLKKWL